MIESTIRFDSKPVRYFPVLDFKSLTLFGAFQKCGLRELTAKSKLVSQAGIKENFRVLDIGCETGILTMLSKKNQPTPVTEFQYCYIE